MSIGIRGIYFMAKLDERHRGSRSRACRFRPAFDDAGAGSGPLERRLLLSGGAGLAKEHTAAHVESLHAKANHHVKAAHHAKAPHPPKRLTITAEVSATYAAFLSAFNMQLASYVASFEEQSAGTVPVTTTLTAAYTTGSAVIEVDDASVFGPEGTFASPLTATATLGNAPPLGTFILTGSVGNLVTIDVAGSSAVNLPQGTSLNANVPTSAVSSAASIFPSYITNSTIQMAISLVRYFNGLPAVLPKENAPPHTPAQYGAIQKFVFNSIAAAQSTAQSPTPSLQQLLLAIPLPTTPGSDLNIYQAAVNSAVAQSRQQVLGGIQQIFNRSLLIPATAPANRLGESFNTGSSGGSSTSTSTSSSSTG